MNPQDFLNTARSLVNSSAESDLRTSVSRSYYAVILFYRNYLAQKLGFSPEDLRTFVHTFVPECFTESGFAEGEKIGEKILRSKADRTRADYKLSETISKTKAEGCLNLATKLISNTLSSQVEQAVLEQATTRAKARRLI